MLKKVSIAAGLLLGSFLAAWGASSTLSGLSAGGPISGTDLFYDVQTPGVGGVKVTGTQFLSFVYGNVSGNCSASASGVFTCVSNFSTATPTFARLTTTIASVTGWLTAAGVNVQTVTINSLGSSTQCLQSVAGVVTGTGSACGSGSSVKGGPLLPSSEYLGGASGLLAPTFYIPAINTSGAGAFEGIAMIPTSTIATASLQFNMPENIPSGNARLRILQMSTGTTGSVQYTVADAVTSSSNSLGAVTLNFEGVFSVAQTVSDQLIEKKILLTVTPTANQIMSVVIGTTSSVVPPIVYQPSIVWE